MLVDDDPHVLAALGRLFRRENYNILKAGSGNEALELFDKYDAGVVISDQCMPHMMGDEFLNKVKDCSPDTMRIMLSGADDFNMVTKAINNGAIYRFLTKPFDNDILLDNVRDAFHKYELNYENKKLTDEIKEANNTLLEKNRKLDEALEKANIAVKAKSDFLANTSHELRTPLNGILGMAELLTETNLDVKQKKYADAIIKSGNSLLSNINDILDLSKFEAGHYVLEFIDFSLRSITEDIVETLSVLAHKKGIEIDCKIDKNFSDDLVGDPDALRKILTNLTGNAIKFTSKGRVIIKILCTGHTESHISTRMEVKDTGIGISPDAVEKIFESFTQADSNTTRLYGGTGLGLNICKNIVESMDGKIGVESEKGAGSTFWVALELEKSSESSSIELQTNSKEKNNDVSNKNGTSSVTNKNSKENCFKGNILVVDDNEINQEVAKGMLEKLGCTVDIAENGEDAVKAYDIKHYDLMLMDCQMPVMDGFKATEIIRKIERDRSRAYPDLFEVETKVLHVPIVAMTANSLPVDKERCFYSGMDEYLKKPVDMKSIIFILERWLDSGQYVERMNDIKDTSDNIIKVHKDLVDIKKLNEVRGILQEKFSSIIDIFLEDTPMRLNTIYKAIDAGNNETAWKTAHLISGSAGTLALTGFMNSCRQLENYIKEGNEGDEYVQLAALDEEFSAVREALKSIIDEDITKHDRPETINVSVGRAQLTGL